MPLLSEQRRRRQNLRNSFLEVRIVVLVPLTVPRQITTNRKDNLAPLTPIPVPALLIILLRQSPDVFLLRSTRRALNEWYEVRIGDDALAFEGGCGKELVDVVREVVGRLHPLDDGDVLNLSSRVLARMWSYGQKSWALATSVVWASRSAICVGLRRSVLDK